ncbi:MAG: purine phosphorylase [Rhodospirillales bacterium]|nr:purine phosphorylase [Rhodospirillales bacterium]
MVGADPGAGPGVVTGLAREARCLGPQRGSLSVVCSGARSERARALAEALAADDCPALISFGLAGGLDPALASGTLVVADRIVAPDGRSFVADVAWRRRLLAATGGESGACAGAVIGCDEAVGTPDEKAALFARTDAAAVDMESHAVAEVAERRSLPLLVVRAIADPADQRIPNWLAGVIGADGRPRLTAVVFGLVACPSDLATLIRLGKDARRGLRTLSRVAARSGPGLAFAT